MTAPVIDGRLYDDEKRKRLQRDLESNYLGIEPLVNGKYPASMGVEAAQIADGFAYLEYVLLTKDISFERIHGLALEKCGADNFRLTQPVPKRFLKERNSLALAIYLRYSVPLDESVKLRIKK